LTLALLLAAPLLHAQAWPARPIRVVVGTGPAVAPDILARIIGDRLGQAIVPRVRGDLVKRSNVSVEE
jgi:tripartite-type tricarboxylate transporter receptor subunit TctC